MRFRAADMTVGSVTVNGHPARFRFVQPTYPGDPNGPNDPSPAAHEASQVNPVGGPAGNPLPPACAPGGGANRPMITGPGLDGPGFYSAPEQCN